MTFKSIPTLSALAWLLAHSASADGVAGYVTTSFEAPHHDAPFEAAIWYPAADGSDTRIVNENPVFYGVEVAPDATPADGARPLVLLSHGMGGNYRSMTWLGAGLAKRGAIVVAVNHPHSSTWSFDIRAGLNHWTRAQDLSFALDSILADAAYAVDTDRIMAAGFSYGGWTALSLGGVTANLDAYADHCAAHLETSSHCADIARAGVALGTLDAQPFDASYKDARVTMVSAIDPALHYGLTEEDVAEAEQPLQMFALGQGADRLLATDFSAEGSGFDALVPEAEIIDIVPASHFMALPLCKPAGEAILKEENDDPVCTDPAGADRAEVHRTIVDAMARQLGL